MSAVLILIALAHMSVFAALMLPWTFGPTGGASLRLKLTSALRCITQNWRQPPRNASL